MLNNNYDIVIVGAGPAGAIAALNLAPFYSVLLIEKQLTPKVRIGESLIAASKLLLSDMGLYEEFIAQDHLPYYGNWSKWETDKIIQNDFLRDPYGHGWHVDRPKLESWLQNQAVARGAKLLTSSHITQLEKSNQQWNLAIHYQNQHYLTSAKFIIDASGRNSTLSKNFLKNHKKIFDRLVCRWVIVKSKSSCAHISYIEAVEKGWWYTAPIPGEKRLISFHTDYDLSSDITCPNSLLTSADTLPDLKRIIGADKSLLYQGYTAAYSTALTSFAGEGWLAIGDAAISFDPIASQGVYNAIYTGLLAAYTIDAYFKNEPQALLNFRQQLELIMQKYTNNLNYYYSLQTKWPDSIFWQRRHKKHRE